MLCDAHRGKFRLIITKEVSRFSRNILDTIGCTRELKALGVGVLFLNDGIYTLDSDAELRLSIMGSIAQEESRRTSERVKWGQTRQMEQGIVFGRSMLGYDVRNGKLYPEPNGAELVRLIFYKYGIEKKGTSVISRELQNAGYCTYSGNLKWSSSHIIKILKNEKYVGDLVQKKTYTPNYLTHEKKTNHGAEAQIILRDHHEPIINRELWNMVQTELARRNTHNGNDTGHSPCHLFSGKIKCGECGAGFISRTRKLKHGSLRRWRCSTASTEGVKHMDFWGNTVGCDIGKMLRDDTATEMVKCSLNSLRLDRECIIHNITNLTVETLFAGENGILDTPERLRNTIRRTEEKKEKVLDAFFSGDVTAQELECFRLRYDDQLIELRKRLEAAENRNASASDEEKLREKIRQELTLILSGQIESQVLYQHLLECITVYQDGHLELKLNELPQIFRFGEKITRGDE